MRPDGIDSNQRSGDDITVIKHCRCRERLALLASSTKITHDVRLSRIITDERATKIPQ